MTEVNHDSTNDDNDCEVILEVTPHKAIRMFTCI